MSAALPQCCWWGEVRQLCRVIGIPKKLSELGVEPGIIPNMASDAMKSGYIMINPR